MNDELLKYFMEETNRELHQIKENLEDLKQFKISMMASAKLTSMIISSCFGVVSLALSVLVVWLHK